MRAVPSTRPAGGSSSELTAPGVAFEACAAFDGEETEPGICRHCGWLDDEHTLGALAA